MIACECSGCGRLEVVEDKAALEIRRADDSGHHVAPDDAEADWICYGKPERIADDDRATEVRQAFRRRAAFGLAELGPDQLERARRRDVVDVQRRADKLAADVAVEALELEGDKLEGDKLEEVRR